MNEINFKMKKIHYIIIFLFIFMYRIIFYNSFIFNQELDNFIYTIN